MSASSSGDRRPPLELAGEFERTGKRLFSEHLIGANFGNMSVRSGDGFLITRTGTFLDEPADLVYVPMEGAVPGDASSEYRVHRQIYRKTDHTAVVHAHPAFAVACSLCSDAIKPVDSEGLLFAPVIPVVNGPPGSEELGANVAEALSHTHVVIVRRHGTFAGGKSLEEGYIYTSIAEHCCRVLVLSCDPDFRRPG